MKAGNHTTGWPGRVLAFIAAIAAAPGCSREAHAMEKEMRTATTTPIACSLSALTSQERARSRRLREALGSSIERVEENADGYTYRFRNVPGLFMQLAEWIPLEHRCCPFLTSHVRWEAGEAQPSLALAGPEGTTAFLRAEMPELPREPAAEDR
jgi:hypothetical protein